jgi:VanZ family protein
VHEGLRRWLPVALWIAVILALGQGSFSAEATRSSLAPFLRLLGFGPEAIETTHVVLRKGAHVGEFGVLGALTGRALAAGPPGAFVTRAALLALGVAALDEGLQARRPARTGSPLDVALDLAGAGLGIALAKRSRRARTRASVESPPTARLG